VLTDLVSRWIMGHHPSQRRQALAIHVQAVRDLIELNEDALSDHKRGEPEDW